VERANILDTLAWASFACGLDEDALEASREALEAASAPIEKLAFEEFLVRIARAIGRERGPERGAALAAARQRLEVLQREVLGQREPRFASEEESWWYAQLAALVSDLEALADERHGLLRGLSARHGWGLERRLRFAEQLEERSRTGAAARALWTTAIAETRGSPPYAGLDLVPQLGLVPLGADPESGLQEFADLASGIPPQRAADGRLVLDPESSVVFVLVPGGEARIGAQALDEGAPHFDPQAAEEESPVHSVHLDPFLVSKYELTQEQWLALTGRNPSKYPQGVVVRGREMTGLSPAEQISWDEAALWLDRFGWMLPTEVQWEYAARAGTETPWWTGAERLTLEGACNVSDRFARDNGMTWPRADGELDDGHLVHAPIGSFDANPFGLHDTVGNLFEWCREDLSAYVLAAAPGTGLRAGGPQDNRVVRGGSFTTPSQFARVSKRDSGPPALFNEAIGIRPVRPLER
jgi:formylglycine-generating enzyme required for sulfatase activity